MSSRSRNSVKPQYLIGIDLGTTHCSIAYAPLTAGSAHELQHIEQFPIAQMTSLGVQGDAFLLPSFIYFPLEEEKLEKEMCIGLFAKERGKEVPDRMVSSAKSWLCHNGVDRHAPLLPLHASEECPHISPLDAIVACLVHMKEAWDEKFPSAQLEDQSLFITVPASFAPDARQLVEEAAKKAGYPEVALLEEPQSAFYAWLYDHHEEWRQRLKVGENILVVDIGGGTTDFSLIAVEEEEGDLSLRRIAVGDHLLLGGDNLDLALAYYAKGKIENEGASVDEWQLHHLVASCRKAKEMLLSDEGNDQETVSAPGRGRKLIGGSLSTTLTRKEVEEFILNGFLPLVERSELACETDAMGMRHLGLPYAKDPRITSHLALFLARSGCLPEWVLFNGGTLKGDGIRMRILAQLDQWADHEGKDPIKVLPSPDYDFAVSRGAAYYGLVRQGKGIRIRGGTNRSYFIGVESPRPAIPGLPSPMDALCIVPFGMEEGTEVEVEGKEFSLLLGEMATFEFFCFLSNTDAVAVGTMLSASDKSLKKLQPIETFLEKGADDGRTVRVTIKAKVTELGVLELYCVAQDKREWKLEFETRKLEPSSAN